MTTLTTADLAPSAQPEPAPDPRPLSAPISRALSLVVLVLLAALLVDVLFEGWVQQLFGHPGLPNAKGDPTWILADWPKNVKTGLFLLVLGFTVIKVAVDKSWRDFFTKAELALVALGVIMAISGFFGGSGAVLIGQALFVYFRGVIVFFAWRAVRPTTKQLKPILYLVGGIAVLNAGLAIVETLIGYPAYQWLGWTDLTWARINRAHALLNHPNHLGHFLMIVEIGLIAWFSTKDKISKKLWFLFGFLALGMSATQSRESAIGFVLAAVVIWWMRRRPVRPLAIALILVVGFTGLQLLNSTENRVTLEKRILGVLAALHFGAGSSAEDQPGIPAREIRVLFYQQGAKLFVERPVLGYGVGQFGGTVAFQHDPTWYKKFNFNLYGAKPDQVDSFWLHLAVETGALGVLGYLVWLFFLIAPMVRSRTRGPDVSPYVLWGPPVVVAAVVAAFLSPSLEDQLFPVLFFTVLGLGWSALRRGDNADTVPATLLAGPALSVTKFWRPAVLAEGATDDHLKFSWRSPKPAVADAAPAASATGPAHAAPEPAVPEDSAETAGQQADDGPDPGSEDATGRHRSG
ncbi:hypothetical protein GCM10009765_27940 [Fodinicola feengrottensis]|uniref:O-antigen ligase-related domain-containing protein n=1 Tax=Fodinicola feengrottensis TaxID=435914 RepID=A0ABP4SRS1_9ACTN